MDSVLMSRLTVVGRSTLIYERYVRADGSTEWVRVLTTGKRRAVKQPPRWLTKWARGAWQENDAETA